MKTLLLVAALCPPTILPPAPFDKPFPGRIVEYALPLDRIESVCGTIPGKEVSGCGYRVHVTEDGTPTGKPVETFGVIVYPEGCFDIRRHEMGHLNGWRH